MNSSFRSGFFVSVLVVLMTAIVPLFAQDAANLADLAQHRERWPAQVTLAVPVKMVITSNGRAVGSIMSPDGTTVDLVAVTPAGLQVRVMQATATIPPEQTDLWTRVHASPATNAAVVAAPPSTPAPIPTPAPISATPPPAPVPAGPSEKAADFAVSGPALKFDYEAKPRANYQKAAFRFWSPAYKDSIRGLLVLVPGTNGDGRGMADNGTWQAFAKKYRLGLVGVFFHGTEGSDYCSVSGGSGEAFFEALKQFAEKSGHPEVATARLALYGESAGGQFDYNFVLWKPERVICFVVNKGGYYDQSGSQPRSRAVPGLFILGLKDEDYRVTAINGIWNEGRGRGALWALARQPNSGHEFSRTGALARAFFDPVLKVRLPGDTLGADPAPLNPMDETKGWLGDLATFDIHDAAADSQTNRKAAWFPDQASATAWKAFVSK